MYVTFAIYAIFRPRSSTDRAPDFETHFFNIGEQAPYMVVQILPTPHI